MEGSSSSSAADNKEEVTEKTAINPYHPCYFLQEALKSLFKCLGIAEEDPINPAGKSTSSEEVPEPEERGADPPSFNAEAGQGYYSSSNTQTLEPNINTNRNGSRRTILTPGPGPQHN